VSKLVPSHIEIDHTLLVLYGHTTIMPLTGSPHSEGYHLQDGSPPPAMFWNESTTLRVEVASCHGKRRVGCARKAVLA
jgi:hypothetical protein